MDTGSIPVGSTRKRLKIGNNLESFSTKSTLSGGINRMHDEIPLAWDEIRLVGGWVDLISSKLVWISSANGRFHRVAISFLLFF